MISLAFYATPRFWGGDKDVGDMDIKDTRTKEFLLLFFKLIFHLSASPSDTDYGVKLLA